MLISTSKGWIIRQAIKQASVLGATISSSIVTKVALSEEGAKTVTDFINNSFMGLATGGVSVALILIEAMLSKKASKIAVK